jgi:hypothetical protein
VRRDRLETELKEMVRRLTIEERETFARLVKKMQGLSVPKEAANGNGTDNLRRPKIVPVSVPTPDAGTNGAEGGGSPGG